MVSLNIDYLVFYDIKKTNMKTFLFFFSTGLVTGIIYTMVLFYQKQISFNYGFLSIATLATFLYLIILSLKRMSKRNDKS